nr:hypothetical protein Iba_chr08aCG10820 [Ipomoea batatas]
MYFIFTGLPSNILVNAPLHCRQPTSTRGRERRGGRHHHCRIAQLPELHRIAASSPRGKNFAFVSSSENERTIAKKRTRRHSHLEELHCRKQGTAVDEREHSTAAAALLIGNRGGVQIRAQEFERNSIFFNGSQINECKTQNSVPEESSDGHQGRGTDHGGRNRERECGSGIRRRSWSRSDILSRSSDGEDDENDSKEEGLHDANLRHLRNNDAFCGL